MEIVERKNDERRGRFRGVNINEFSTIGYFIKYYFNWSMDYTDLENCIDDFLTREKQEDKKAFRQEVKRMHSLNNPEFMRKVAYKLGDRGMPKDRALDMIKLMHTKTQKENN